MEQNKPTTSPLSEAAKAIGFVFAMFGWLWFGTMLFFKLSGATIYATTDQSIIKAIDPVWEDVCSTSNLQVGGAVGLNFTVRIQGVQSDSPRNTN